MITAYDTATASFGTVPTNAEAILPYMDGNFNNVAAAKVRFPHLFAAHRVLTLTARANDADGVDWEPGDTNPDPAAWYEQQHKLGRFRPCYYADLSDMKTHVIPRLNSIGLKMGAAGSTRPVRLLSAHPTQHEHICGPSTCGQIDIDMDGTQYWWSSIARSSADIDISLLRDDFFGGSALADPNAIFPTFVGDHRLPNSGNERLTVEQARGALKQPVKYHDYLKGRVFGELKQFRDRVKRVSLYEPPDFVKLRATATWGQEHRGARWRELNDLMQRIAALRRIA